MSLIYWLYRYLGHMNQLTDSDNQVLFPGQQGQPVKLALLPFAHASQAPIQNELEPARLPVKEYLTHFFQLTPAEAELTRLLVTGKSVAECAEHLGVSIHTVRSHLKKAMSKTRTNRQGALIGLLLRQLNRVDGH